MSYRVVSCTEDMSVLPLPTIRLALTVEVLALLVRPGRRILLLSPVPVSLIFIVFNVVSKLH